VVGLRERSKKVAVITEGRESPVLARPGYVDYSAEKMQATFVNAPTREDIPLEIQENLIVEFYSQMV